MSEADKQPGAEPDAPGTSTPAGQSNDASLAARLGKALARELTRELGDATTQSLMKQWQAFRDWDQRQQHAKGLRETKKRLTRQQISDVATALFIARGFDNVTVAEIAATVGVSEKTVYNYFPTKESLVLDHTDEQLEHLAAAVRDRGAGTSPTAALSAALLSDERLFGLSDADAPEPRALVAAFGEMFNSTPALRAAWSEHQGRLVETLSEILAAEFDVDPRDPEPSIMAQALAGMMVVYQSSVLRHSSDGLVGVELRRQVEADLTRAGRLLDTGFWSLPMLVGTLRTRRQLQDAAAVAEQSRQLVAAAMQEAKLSWREMRDQFKRELKESTRRETKQSTRPQAGKQTGREDQESPRSPRREHRR